MTKKDYKIFIDNGGQNKNKKQLIVLDDIYSQIINEFSHKPNFPMCGQKAIINNYCYELVSIHDNELHFIFTVPKRENK